MHSLTRNHMVGRLSAAVPNVFAVRIVRLANFVTPRSGGLRTALQALGEGYLAAGHEPVLVIPGRRAGDEQTSSGRLVTVRGSRVPWTGGYRVMLGAKRLAATLERLEPDRIEVSDRFTLRWTGRWAREHGVASVMVSHESLRGLLSMAGLPGPFARYLADRVNARTVRRYDTVVCTTAWASEEFDRFGAANIRRVPLGVDLELFHPDRYDPDLRDRLAGPDQVMLVHCGRLSMEKRPTRSVQALARLCAAGIDAVLVVAGDGPLRGKLVRQSEGLPVRFLDFVPDKPTLAGLLATADVVIAPGPIETFGLAALEALACGTPVVVDASSALPEVVGDAGVAVYGEGDAFADGIAEVLRRQPEVRRLEARKRAEEFSWAVSVRGFLAAHHEARSAVEVP
jgi:alpha-1,6-mannosyltransferase